MSCNLRVVHRSGRRRPHSPSLEDECRGSRDSYLYQNDELNYRIDFKCFVGLEFSNFHLKIIFQPPYVPADRDLFSNKVHEKV